MELAKGKKTTRAKRKVEGGSDVEDGEVEEVDWEKEGMEGDCVEDGVMV